MSERVIRVKPSRLDQLLDKLAALPSKPEGPCVVEDEVRVLGYVKGKLEPDEVERIANHLASCATCTENLGWLLEQWEVWRGPEGEARLAAFQQRVEQALAAKHQADAQAAFAAASAAGVVPAAAAKMRGETSPHRLALLDRFMEWFLEILPLFPGLAVGAEADAEKEDLQVESPDELFAAFVHEDADGNLLVRIGSKARELDGVAISLYAGDWERRIRFQRDQGEWVIAELTIARTERSGFRLDEKLRVSLPEGETGQRRTD